MARNKGLIIALEDADLDQATAGASEAEIPESQLEVEEGVQEVEADVANVEELVTAVEDAEADAETLGEIEGVMEESIEEGEGLDETSAELAEVAVESIRLRLGFAPSRTLPALESFGSKNSRLTATKIALEGVTETIKTIWKKIKEAFQLVWQKIKDFFAKFFTNTEKVKKLAQQLKTKARDTKGKVEKDTVDAAGVANAFNVDGKASLQSANSILENHMGLTAGALAGQDVIKSGVELLNTMVRKPEDADPAKVEESLKDYIKSLKISGVVEESGDGTTVKVGPFLNGMNLSIKVTDGNLAIQMDSSEKKAEKAVKVLSPKEAEALCDSVVALMTKTEEYKKQQSKIEAVSKALVKLADSAISAADTIASAAEDNAEVKATIGKVRKAASAFNTATARMTTMTPAWNVQAGKMAMKYVDVSLKQYKEEEAK